MRAQARRRLIGAVVLLGVGVIAFPLLFETEPRPIPVDLPIVIPPRDGAPPLAMPGPASAPKSDASSAPTPAAAADKPEPTTVPAEPVPDRTASPEPPAPAPDPDPVVAQPTAPPKAPADDGARARALLEGKQAAKTAVPSANYAVQIGAFAEANTVREVRAKARKAGLETFTQVVTVASGEVTRVRVGPFSRREDADAAAAKAVKAGLPASVLKL